MVVSIRIFNLAAIRALNMRGDDGETALTRAASSGDSDEVKRLIRGGARVDGTNRGHDTALMTAARNGHARIIAILLKAGAKTWIQDSQNETPLMVTAAKGHARCVEKLIAHKANPDIQNIDGDTALMLAIKAIDARDPEEGAEDSALALMEAGADVNAKNKFGITPLMLAFDKDNERLVSSLFHYGADKDIVTLKGDCAASFVHSEQLGAWFSAEDEPAEDRHVLA